MSCSVSLPVLLFRIKNHFGLTKIAIFSVLPKKIGNLSFFLAKGSKNKVRPTLNFVVFTG